MFVSTTHLKGVLNVNRASACGTVSEVPAAAWRKGLKAGLEGLREWMRGPGFTCEAESYFLPIAGGAASAPRAE
jgi:hypothetical protein